MKPMRDEWVWKYITFVLTLITMYYYRVCVFQCWSTWLGRKWAACWSSWLRMRSRETCPVQPLLRLSLVGSQPMRTLLGKGGSTASCACAAGNPARSSRYSGCHWSLHSQWGHCQVSWRVLLDAHAQQGNLPGPAATQAVIGRLTANGDIAR